MTKSGMISIVVPAFNEEGNLERLYEEILQHTADLDLGELLIVDDGSRDGTWANIQALHKRDPRVVGLRFSRNFGHQYALLAGLNAAKGNAVITMDADLQHPPALIPAMVKNWQTGYKIVKTARKDNEKTPFLKRVTSRWFYKTFSFLCGVDLSKGMADFRLLDRQVVSHIIQNKEVSLFLRGLIEWVGFDHCVLEYTSQDRFSGKTKYGLMKMIKFAWTGITSFTIVPLRLGILLGLISSAYAFYRLFYAWYIKRFTDLAVPGWASTIGVMSLLFGILFILLGILGEYIGRILIQVQGRERFIVSDRTDGLMASPPEQLPLNQSMAAKSGSAE